MKQINTPICDFVRGYAEKNMSRMHMPGHKGKGLLGVESLDITELAGADSLYEADGIIQESEENASALFGAHTFYSTEGSSQCIRAMLHLATTQNRRQNKHPLVWATRNVHKTFLSAVALLNIDVEWLYGTSEESYLSCSLSPARLEEMLKEATNLPTALYLTSPDYLGNVADIASIAEVCHRYGMLLLVDCAHGAYLRFLPTSLYPTDLGADMCCSSAHKTLPVLTGGAYLHISKNATANLVDAAKNALALFGSTSPSYLILQSLDAANVYLAKNCRENLARTVAELDKLKKSLASHGYQLVGNEPLKITLATKSFGYTGVDFASHLRENGIECEFADQDFVVLMPPTDIGTEELAHIETVATSLLQKEPITVTPPALAKSERALRITYALLWPSETVAVEDSIGRILASPSVSCPPAVPIVLCGERIDEAAVEAFRYYGVEKLRVVIEIDRQLDKL